MARHPAGSLTKEFPLDSVDQTIGAITPGMTFDQMRTYAGANTHDALAPILRNRYLLVQPDGQIVYDELLSLIAAEGMASPRVRKAMYFLWAFRDDRIRRFVLEKLANNQGLWRPAEVVRKGNAAFFSDQGFVEEATAPKVRSNFERFLVETGIFDEDSHTVHLELDDDWLPAAMRIAAQYERNPLRRRQMLADPAGFLIANGWQGLANATAATLRGLPAVIDPSPEPLEDEQLEGPAMTPGTGHEWNRRPPTHADRTAAAVTTNPVAVERANTAHHKLEALAARLLRDAGRQPLYSKHIDMYVTGAPAVILAEMKSCQRNNLRSQVRRGISQLLEYRYVYRAVLGTTVTMLLVLETAPSTRQQWLVEYAKELGIIIAWKEVGADRLVSTATLPPALAGLVNPA
jgi:hypothetical protein